MHLVAKPVLAKLAPLAQCVNRAIELICPTT
jgi:hypothetical protein